MSITSLPRTFVPCTSDVRLFASRWMVGTVDTLNSRYTLVKRDNLIVLIKDTDRADAKHQSPVEAGEVQTFRDATAFLVDTGERFSHQHALRIQNEDGHIVFQSSFVTSVYVLEN